VTGRLSQAGLAVQMRMIDGELAMPDEEPPADWREIRVAYQGEMITIRRGNQGEVQLVGWGNLNATAMRLFDALEQAFLAG
jgi:hypothetical protein